MMNASTRHTAGTAASESTSPRKVVIFDLEVEGHHSGYIRHLVSRWASMTDELVVVVAPDFLEQHSDVVATESAGKVRWVAVTEEEIHQRESAKGNLLTYSRVEWGLFCRYAKRENADHAVIMHIDLFQLPLAFRWTAPCKLSGIYFRPKFHLAWQEEYQPSWKERIQFQREKWFWGSALRHSKLTQLFCLDPFAVQPLQALRGTAGVSHLPDPVEIYPPASDEALDQLRTTLNIDPQRKVLLLFGALDERKGIFQLLAAAKLLEPEQQSRLTLLLVGPVAEVDKVAATAAMESLAAESNVQICIHDRFVTDQNIQPYFSISDAVSLLYQRHVGMSAVLVRAAAADKPVLAANFGLISRLVQQDRLGLTMESSCPRAIKEGIGKLLDGTLRDGFDSKNAQALAALNNPQEFASRLLDV